MTAREIYVIVHDGGCEGMSGPIQGCATLDEAVALATLMKAAERYAIFAVPIWPNAQPEPWFNLKPVWPTP
jgi:hypothetical protein